ncbi:hypothetical protein VL2_gp148 [Pseudomonas phage vB_PaeM_VL12]|nr:hypothetical protein VL2_gp148 [Pseudomonas phage vB_PaeM_VL12]
MALTMDELMAKYPGIEDIYTQLEDALYNVAEAALGDFPLVLSYCDNQQTQTPALYIEPMDIKSVFTEQVAGTLEIDPTDPERAVQEVTKWYTLKARFTGLGSPHNHAMAAAAVQHLEFFLSTEEGYQALESNGFSKNGANPIRRIRDQRPNELYQHFRYDVHLSYAITRKEEVTWIEALELDAVYTNAGREPDHVIKNHISLNEEP